MIQYLDEFVEESGILKIDPNTKYKIKEKRQDYYILTYGNEQKNTIKVPNALIPFWTNSKENLYYKNGKFYRNL